MAAGLASCWRCGAVRCSESSYACFVPPPPPAPPPCHAYCSHPLVALQAVAFADLEALGASQPAAAIPPSAQQLTTIMYTSGTTGGGQGPGALRVPGEQRRPFRPALAAAAHPVGRLAGCCVAAQHPPPPPPTHPRPPAPLCQATPRA